MNAEIAKETLKKGRLTDMFMGINNKTEYHTREYDGAIIKYIFVPDPCEKMEDWVGREMLFPMRWVPEKILTPLTLIKD